MRSVNGAERKHKFPPVGSDKASQSRPHQQFTFFLFLSIFLSIIISFFTAENCNVFQENFLFCIARKTEIKKLSTIYDENFFLLDNPIKVHFAHTI